MNRRKRELLIAIVVLIGAVIFGIFFTGLAISDMSRTLAPPYELWIGIAFVIMPSIVILALWKRYRKNR